MSGGNRLNREELRDEVKDYLVALREERIQRSIEVSERLRQLRVARVERLRNSRGSMVVTASLRENKEESFSRESLRTRVKEMRAEVQEMLKQYKATRSSSTDTQFESTPSAQETINQASVPSVDNRKVARAVGPDKSKMAQATTPIQSEYQDRLSQVVTDLGKKERSFVQKDRGKSVQVVEDSPRQGQSLMGRIRRLASGNFRGKSSQEKETSVNSSPQQMIPVPDPMQEVADPKLTTSDGRRTTFGSSDSNRNSKSIDSVEQETIHRVIRRASDTMKEQTATASELLEINGIGPSVLKRLHRIGICTFQDLASTSLSKLESSFGEYAKLTDLGDWMDQAKARIRNS